MGSLSGPGLCSIQCNAKPGATDLISCYCTSRQVAGEPADPSGHRLLGALLDMLRPQQKLAKATREVNQGTEENFH